MEKGKWISAKIRELEHENKGRSHEQNIAIAFSMWGDRKEDGGEQLPKLQDANWGLGSLKPIVPKKEKVESNVNTFGFPVTSNASYSLPGSPSTPTAQQWVQKATGKNEFGFPVNTNPNYGTPVTATNNNPNWGKSVTATAGNSNFVAPFSTSNAVRGGANAFSGGSTPASATPTKPTSTTPTASAPTTPAPTTDKNGTQYFNNYTPLSAPSFDVNMPQGFPQQTSALSEDNLTLGKDWAAKNPLPEFQTEKGNFNYDPNAVDAEKFSSSLGDITDKTVAKEDTPVSIDTTDKHRQFYNPYGGIDLETSLLGLGEGIQRGDAKAITTNSILAGLKSLKTVGAGAGRANRENQVMQDYWDQQRQGMIGNATVVGRDGGYFQDGGEQFQNPQEEQVEGPQGQNPQEEGQEQQGGQQEQMMQQIAQAIQGGATPEQVVQKLVESGIPQEQAVQMVQAVMQQMQGQQQQQAPQQPQMKDGGEYLSILKGKKIKDYKLDTKTNMYTVEYE